MTKLCNAQRVHNLIDKQRPFKNPHLFGSNLLWDDIVPKIYYTEIL